jgi:anti-sigma factor RsiW
MSTTVPEHPADWEAQRERLSALLDGQLSAAESVELRAHVHGCARCTDELDALRRVVAALRALPQPVASRSFALPVATTLPGGAPLPSMTTARARPARWAGVTQWSGAVAACIGFVILCGTLLVGGGYGAQNTASFGAMRQAPSSAGLTHATVTQPPAASPTQSAMRDTALATPPSAATSAPSRIATPAATSSAAGHTIGVLEAPDPRATARITGVSLLLGGLAALLLGWRVRRRGAPR